MSELKYKIGDKVLVKDIGWYNENKSKRGSVSLPYKADIAFTSQMSLFCGQIVTITRKVYFEDVGSYLIKEDKGAYMWTDEMIECKVEEETKPKYEDEKNGEAKPKYEDEVNGQYYSTPKYLVRPNGYQFVDENGNIINAQKIVLEKKKKGYPKTYEECCRVLGVSEFEYNHTGTNVWYRHNLMAKLDKLMLCRDAYWELYGDEMGLGKPWAPDYRGTFEHGTPIKYVIYNIGTHIVKERKSSPNHILSFPTEEMAYVFYENFKFEIEFCKELL